MHVDAEADELLIVIEDTVEVLEEDVAEDVGTAVCLVKRVLSDSELALFTLMQVSLRAHLEDDFSDLERDRSKLALNGIALLVGRAEGITAVEVANRLLPFLGQGSELVARHCEERAARVNDSWVLHSLLAITNRFSVVQQVPGFESPRFDG